MSTLCPASSTPYVEKGELGEISRPNNKLNEIGRKYPRTHSSAQSAAQISWRSQRKISDQSQERPGALTAIGKRGEKEMSEEPRVCQGCQIKFLPQTKGYRPRPDSRFCCLACETEYQRVRAWYEQQVGNKLPYDKAAEK